MSFPTTRWSLIAAAAHDDGREGRRALEELCRRYRGPVLSFFRAKVYTIEDAEDLTQNLFLQIHQKHIWRRVDADKGRFRSYLLVMATNAYRTWKQAVECEKRGGHVDIASLDLLSETGQEPASPEPDVNLAFDIGWAAAALNAAWRSVEEAAASTPEKLARFAVLRRFLPGAHSPMTYEEASEALGLSMDNIRVLVMRLRREFKKALRAEIADTLLESEDLEEEMQYLHSVMKHAGGSQDA